MSEEEMMNRVCCEETMGKAASDCSASRPNKDEVLKAVYDSGLHQYAPKGVLVTKWKDGIDLDEPSAYLMNFVRCLWQNTKSQEEEDPDDPEVQLEQDIMRADALRDEVKEGPEVN